MRIAVTIVLFSLTAFAQPSDPIIEAARRAASQYRQSLPSYLVLRSTNRYVNVKVDDLTQPSPTPESRHYPTHPTLVWQLTDYFSAEVTSQGRGESYSDIKVRDRPAKQIPSDGLWSAGEFATLLDEILSPDHHPVFMDQSSETIRRRPAWRYNFVIDAQHSGWNVRVNLPQPAGVIAITPKYMGAIWIDKQTSGILRIEKSAGDLPPDFPLQLVESATYYSSVRIGDGSYLLPTRSESILCTRNPGNCFKNESTFKNYRKFETNTSITFGK
jgi:hypothetical protein